MKPIVLLALFAALSGAAAPGIRAQDLADLSWMGGSWIERKAGQNTEEHWLMPNGGMMAGVNRTVRDGAKTTFEFLRIEMREGKPVYFASPGGRVATEFRMAEFGPQRVVFENPDKEFPRRIHYWRDGDSLTARTQGRVRGQDVTEEWRFERLH